MSDKTRLPRSTPEEHGISSSAVLSFLDSIEKNNLELHSFMILRHGSVVTEGWWSPYGPQRPHMLFSLSKSFTSTAIGFAVNEGLLSVDDQVISFFPSEAPGELSQNLKAMHIRHLLSMSTGHTEDTTEHLVKSSEGDWAKIFLSLPVNNEPGTTFIYNSGASYMLSAIIQRVAGQTLLDYLMPRLFKPLDIEGATWDSSPDSINNGGWGLNIRTEDIAKFGLLYLNKGIYNGVRILPEAWVTEATSKHISNGDCGESDWAQGYGYQFWMCHYNAYRGDGAFGQYCVVIPDKDAVIAITSCVADMQLVLSLIWQHLLPEMSDVPVPTDSKTVAALNEKLEDLKIDPPVVSPKSPMAEIVSGKRYILEENPLKLQYISFDFSDDVCTISLKDNKDKCKWICGIGRWIDDIIDPPENPFLPKHKMPVVNSGTWTDEDTFTLVHRMVETPIYTTISFHFNEDSLQMELSINVSFRPEGNLIIKGKA